MLVSLFLRCFCRHGARIREHRETGWYFVCARCGHATPVFDHQRAS